jgi:hypothetical protein
MCMLRARRAAPQGAPQCPEPGHSIGVRKGDAATPSCLPACRSRARRGPRAQMGFWTLLLGLTPSRAPLHDSPLLRSFGLHPLYDVNILAHKVCVRGPGMRAAHMCARDRRRCTGEMLLCGGMIQRAERRGPRMSRRTEFARPQAFRSRLPYAYAYALRWP